MLKPASYVDTVNKGEIVGEETQLTFLTDDAHARDVDDVGKRIEEGEDGSVTCLLR